MLEGLVCKLLIVGGEFDDEEEKCGEGEDVVGRVEITWGGESAVGWESEEEEKEVLNAG